MVGIDANDIVLGQQAVLEQALSTNKATQKALQKLIRAAILEARAEVVKNIRFANGDPRGAARSVRTSVYRKVLGANINIYNSRKAGSPISYEPPRKGVSGRGGNRRQRNAVTRRIMTYGPESRGFILRFVNSGTDDRVINFTPNDKRKHKNANTGNRGNIEPRNFFRNLAGPALTKAVDSLATMIDTELEAIINKKR